MKEKKLSIEADLPCYMFDCNDKLRPAAFMDIAQQLAGLGAIQLGFSDQDMSEHGIVWILARMRAKFIKTPEWLDHVTQETWHRGLDGLYFIRDYQVLDADGNVAVTGSSSWILMDWNTRTAIRSDHLPADLDFSAQNTDSVLEPAPRIRVPRGVSMEKVAEHKVSYSDLDHNMHANNAKYTVWAMDCLPNEVTSRSDTDEICICFNKEARLGETVELYHAFVDGLHYVEGKVENQQVFILTYQSNNQ